MCQFTPFAASLAKGNRHRKNYGDNIRETKRRWLASPNLRLMVVTAEVGEGNPHG